MIAVCLHSSPCTLTAPPSLVLLPYFQDCHSPHHLHCQETHWTMLWDFLLACIPDFCLVVAGLGMNRICLLLPQSTRFQPLPSQGSPKYSVSLPYSVLISSFTLQLGLLPLQDISKNLMKILFLLPNATQSAHLLWHSWNYFLKHGTYDWDSGETHLPHHLYHMNLSQWTQENISIIWQFDFVQVWAF